MPSEKPFLPPTHLQPQKTAVMLEDNQSEKLVLSAVFGSDLMRPCHVPPWEEAFSLGWVFV